MTKKMRASMLIAVLLILSILMSLGITWLAVDRQENTSLDASQIGGDDGYGDEVAMGGDTGKKYANILINGIRKSSGALLKNYVPGGDIIAETLFDILGIKTSNTSSESKFIAENLAGINSELKDIKDTLETILSNMEKKDSENIVLETMVELNEFSKKIASAYKTLNNDWLIPVARQNDILASKTATEAEKDAARAALDELKTHEQHIYETIQPEITSFGLPSGNMGDIDFVMSGIVDNILNPKRKGKDLFYHYHVAFEHMWAFDVEEVEAKEDLITYITTILEKGEKLFMFVNTYEVNECVAKGDETGATLKRNKWLSTTTDVPAGKEVTVADLESDDVGLGAMMVRFYDLMNKKIAELDAITDANEKDGCTRHRATNIRVNKKIFVGQLMDGESSAATNFYTYADYDKHMGAKMREWRKTSVYTLNASALQDAVVKEYNMYKKGLGNPDLTMVQYLKDIGFTFDDDSVEVMYNGQSYSSDKNNHILSIKTVDKNGNAVTTEWGRANRKNGMVYKYRYWYSVGKNTKMFAFVGSDGKLVGDYSKLVELKDHTRDAFADQLHSVVGGFPSYSSAGVNVGKVR